MDIVGTARSDEDRRQRREFAIVVEWKGGAWGVVVVFVSSAIAESPLAIGELRNLSLEIADDRPGLGNRGTRSVVCIRVDHPWNGLSGFGKFMLMELFCLCTSSKSELWTLEE